jgi:phosphoglycolate phosphatase-like HAD superfamily hydrolase
VLWDIDHTLIDTGGVGRDAYAAAFRDATGVELAEHWRFDGRTELAASVDALAEHGLPAGTEQIERLCESIVAVHAARADQFALRGRVLPGIERALASLAELGHVRQSVLTGNLREVAVIKLKALGLDRSVDLRIGAYGSDAVERAALAPFAFERAARILGLEIGGGDTAIIGDTPRDVEAARAVGALAIGVATGRHSTADLEAAGADHVFADLSDTAALLAAVASPGSWS